MNCTRVLHALGSHSQPAAMPVDLAVCLSLSQRQPLYQLLSMSNQKPAPRRYHPADCLARTSLHSPRASSSPSSSLPSTPAASEPRSCFRRDSGGLNKKHVVFADAKGLALTAVRLYIPEPSYVSSPPAMTPSLSILQGQQLPSNKLQQYKLRLGFPQPMLDPKAFLAHLRDTGVQLESCKLSEHSLKGKVCVSHVSIDKAVHVRVTFDSWQSHHDIPCTFLQQQRIGVSEMDVFAFDLSLPKNIDPKERVEFRVSFRPGPGATPLWDDNRGQNYRVCVEKEGSNGHQSDAQRCFPTLSQYRPQSWASHAFVGVQNSAEPQSPQRSLTSRVTAEWKSLCSTRKAGESGPATLSRATRIIM